MVIAIDFDWTLVRGAKYPDTDYEFMPGAREAVMELAKKPDLALNTSRTGWYRLSAIKFCKDNRLPIRTPLMGRKQKADVYVDDCNLECMEIDWPDIVRRVREMEE